MPITPPPQNQQQYQVSSQEAQSKEEKQKEEEYELSNVHKIYTSIAPHFSRTRYKPWPIVSHFLLAQHPGSVGLDVGCGNGKYLACNPAVYLLGSDWSEALLRIAKTTHQQPPYDLLQASTLALPHPRSRFDFGICIAVIHHLSTSERRIEAVREILSCMRAGAEVLLYVWALEQAGSRRGWDKGGEQDVMVPWVLKDGGKEEVFQRYYHLYCEGELEGDVGAAGGVVVRGGWERDNWWVVARRGEGEGGGL